MELSMAEKLSDRVHHFFTLNEVRNFTYTGYRGLEVRVAGGVMPGASANLGERLSLLRCTPI